MNPKGWKQASQVMRTATEWLGAAVFCFSANLAMAGDIAGGSARDLTQAQVLQMLDAEPDLAGKVAAANGLTTMRLMSLETPTIAAMERDYLMRREHANAAQPQRQGPSVETKKPTQSQGQAARVVEHKGDQSRRRANDRKPTQRLQKR